MPPRSDGTTRPRGAPSGRARPRSARSRPSPRRRAGAATCESRATSPVTTTAETSITLAMYSTASTVSRARFENSQYAVHVSTLSAAAASPTGLQVGEPCDPIATSATPTNDDAITTASRRSSRSPNHRTAPSVMNTGASAPMIVAFATLVSRNAVNVSTMSPAKNTPPSAVALSAVHVGPPPGREEDRGVQRDADPEPVARERERRHLDLLQHQRHETPHHRGEREQRDADRSSAPLNSDRRRLDQPIAESMPVTQSSGATTTMRARGRRFIARHSYPRHRSPSAMGSSAQAE